MNEILNKVSNNELLSKDDIVKLLNTDNFSSEFYLLLSKANEMSRIQYKNKGYIFAQIGINAKPCTGNCKFCSLAKDNYTIGSEFEKSLDEVVAQVASIELNKLDSLFLMTTADFSFKKFIKIGEAVKKIIPTHVHLIANIGDFDDEMAKALVKTGFSGVYHIVRLREGIDTGIPKETRIQTLNAAKQNGLDILYCVEPIGSEHTYDEIADEIIRARDYNVEVMAIMGRTSVKGTPFENSEELTEIELTKIAAVTRIAVNPKKSMNIHEPKRMPLLAGINQFYAEIGINPRDTVKDTENSRGKSINEVEKMLNSANYYV